MFLLCWRVLSIAAQEKQERVKTNYSLSDTVFAKAELNCDGRVCIWLGVSRKGPKLAACSIQHRRAHRPWCFIVLFLTLFVVLATKIHTRTILLLYLYTSPVLELVTLSIVRPRNGYGYGYGKEKAEVTGSIPASREQELLYYLALKALSRA